MIRLLSSRVFLSRMRSFDKIHLDFCQIGSFVSAKSKKIGVAGLGVWLMLPGISGGEVMGASFAGERGEVRKRSYDIIVDLERGVDLLSYWVVAPVAVADIDRRSKQGGISASFSKR